jgi:hypothetical protein
VFINIPSRLPPNKGFQHAIEVAEGVELVITKPYHHPRRHKEIGKVIKEMLDMGYI